MISRLLSHLNDLDTSLFFSINLGWATPYLDVFFSFITHKQHWYLPAGILLVVLTWKGGRRGRWAVLLTLLALILADQLSSSLLKPLIARYRPCKVLEGFRLLVHCGSKYGFPSSHAANIAAIGWVMASFFPRSTVIWVLLGFLIGLSRVYVGVHYPLDVVAGWMLGMLIGGGIVWGWRRRERGREIPSW